MRLDSRIERANLQTQQLFFIECWSSLTSLHSIDSDRVTYNNALNATIELLELYTHGEKHKAADKRSHVMTELLEIFRSDLCFTHVEFKEVTSQIISLCDNKDLRDHNTSPIEKKRLLISSLLTQFKEKILLSYRAVAIDVLRERILHGEKSDTDTLTEIYHTTNLLISTLLTLGMPISECYLLSRNYLRERTDTFENQFQSFTQKISAEESQITITLRLLSERLHSLIGSTGQSFEFKNCRFEQIPSDKNNMVSVDIVVNAISFSAARQIAESELYRALDVVAYMMGRDEIKIEKKYRASTIANDIEHTKTLPHFDKQLVNASDRLNSDEFSLYIRTMSKLYKNAEINTVRKVSSAFRFFRNGVLTDGTPESRFTAFWSALESLTLGVSAENLTHDAHVIHSVLPCIGLDYPVKQLFALRGVAKALQWESFQIDGQEVDLRTLNLAELYCILKSQATVDELNRRLEQYPYAKYRFSQLIELCQKPYQLGLKIQKHRTKVEMQIHRIYRTRNAIIHNAATPDRLEMLIVNLEHYLRSTLNSMVYMMDSAPSISSPEEAFNRYQFQAEQILIELDPSLGVKHKDRESITKQIINGNVSAKDELLIKWLKMHN